MKQEPFYINNRMTPRLEDLIRTISTFEEFEERFSDEFLADDDRVGNYLRELMRNYDKDYATVSQEAGLDRSYVGNIINGKKNNPSRNALLAICLTIGTTIDEVQYLLKYAGHAPLYVRRKRDVVIWFGFMKHKSVTDVDIDLHNRGYQLIKKNPKNTTASST